MLTREELEQVVDRESSDAEDGCPRARSLVVNALAELDEMDRCELALRRGQQCEEDFYSSAHVEPSFDPYDNYPMSRFD